MFGFYKMRMVDYDLRDRNTPSETSREDFIAVLSEVVKTLEGLDVNPIASVKVNCATCTSWEASGALSTVGRELMFLHSHTTHHLALISAKLEMTGVTIDPSIGVAPSTQRFYNATT